MIFRLIILLLALQTSPAFSQAPEPQAAPPVVDPAQQGAPAAAPVNPQLEAQYRADIAKCENSKQNAERCCNDPMSCSSAMSPEAKQQMMQLVGMGAMVAMSQMKPGESGGMSPEGIAAICQMMSSMGGAGAGVNDGAAQVCEETRNKCTTACSQTMQQWQTKKDQCAGTCPDAAFYDTALSEFQNRQGTCDALVANTEAMKSQGEEAGGAGGMGEMCSQLASMMPASEEDKKVAKKVIDCNLAENKANPLCVDCKADPENKMCGTPSKDSPSSMAFASGLPVGADSFNTGMGTDGLTQEPQFGNFEAKPNQSGTVSGQGGSIPGGGNDGGGFGSDPAGGGAESAGYNTDILNGERSGSGYSVSGMAVDASGGFSGYGGGYDPGEEMPYEGMDLKKFLPGGIMDPSRRLAGALVNSGQINAQNEDIFQRISARIKAVCSTNRLKDCQKKN